MIKNNESIEKLFSEIKPPSQNKLKQYSLAFLKLVIGICLFPFVFAVSKCFSQELLKLDAEVSRAFITGIISFLAVYLFIWEPAILFKKGQRILEVIFRFFAPLVKIAPSLLPIYAILFFVIYLILSLFVDMRYYATTFIFSIGFSLSLHMVFCSKSLRSKQGDSLKANYIFSFSWVYILNLVLVALFFNLTFDNFSFLVFFNGSCQIAKDIYTTVFRQLFL